MIQEVLLKATPSIARRLVRLAAISNTTVDDTIRELAREPILDEAAFEALPVKTISDERNAIRSMLDYGLRAILLTDMHDPARRTALAAAKLGHARPITVVAAHKQRWEFFAEALGFRTSRDPEADCDVLVIDRIDLVKQAVIEPRRGGVLIWESQDDLLSMTSLPETMGTGPLREFARVILIKNVAHVSHGEAGAWGHTLDTLTTEAASMLFPHAPASLLMPKLTSVEVLRQRGYKRFKPRDLHFLFNVVTDLLPDR